MLEEQADCAKDGWNMDGCVHAWNHTEVTEVV